MAFTGTDYILKWLSEQQVDTLFGVPAAYCAQLFDAAAGHGIRSVVNASELEVGYAAEGYARTKGLGAVSVSYGAGTLNMINAIAGAYLERSPVVVINGGPTSADLSNLHQFDGVFSHSIGQDATDLTAYKLVTAKAARAGTVAGVVDQAISTAIKSKRPVYIEINMAIWDSTCPMPAAPLPVTNPPDGPEHQLAATIVGLIRAAQSSLILVGEEIQRYGVADAGGLGMQFAQTVNTASSFDAALATAKASNGPALIVAQVDARGLPAELP